MIKVFEFGHAGLAGRGIDYINVTKIHLADVVVVAPQDASSERAAVQIVEAADAIGKPVVVIYGADLDTDIDYTEWKHGHRRGFNDVLTRLAGVRAPAGQTPSKGPQAPQERPGKAALPTGGKRPESLSATDLAALVAAPQGRLTPALARQVLALAPRQAASMLALVATSIYDAVRRDARQTLTEEEYKRLESIHFGGVVVPSLQRSVEESIAATHHGAYADGTGRFAEAIELDLTGEVAAAAELALADLAATRS